VELVVTGEWNRPVMTRTPQVAHLYSVAHAVGERIGIDLPEAAVGGASDGNFVAALGIPVLDGLGAVGGGAHARHEHISIAGMVERAALAAGVLATF
jgi:glutamate carboxypeptidase